jgi:hypothetical protein
MENQILHLIIVPLFQQPKCVPTPMSILCILDLYGQNTSFMVYTIVVNAAFLFFETSKLWALIMYIL